MSRSDPDHAALSISLLGRFSVECAGQRLPESAWQRASGKTLLKLLALTPTHRLHREEILDLLWPDSPPASAANSLRKALHYARHAVEALHAKEQPCFVVAKGETIGLSDRVSVDVDRFESLAREALALGHLGRYEEALAGYAGELLSEDRYLDWTLTRRAQLSDLYLRLLLGAACELERRGALARAIERLHGVLEVEPAHEEAHRRLMHLLATTGRRQEAVRQYRVCCSILDQDLAVEPTAETRELYERILVQEESRPAESTYVPGVLGRPAITPLFGREHAADLLREGLNRSEVGAGGLILVSGEAGVGKTRLAEELSRLAVQRGVLVLWGAGYQLEDHFPYRPLVEALEDFLAKLPATCRHDLAFAHPELSRLLPALSSSGPATRGTQASLFDGIAGLLGAIAADRPLLLVLDDLQWADAESLHLLQYLSRIAADRRWLIVGTYREEDVGVGSALQQVLAVAARQEHTHRIHLLRLSSADSDHLVRALLPCGDPAPALLEYLYALGSGNPLYLRELVQSLRELEAIDLVSGGWCLQRTDIRVPPAVGDLIVARVDQMGRDVPRILALAAVAGEECSFAELRAAARIAFPEIGDTALLDALDQALASHLVEEREGEYAFHHPLFRTVLYERLSWARRQQLHLVVAQTVERQRPEDVATLAYHYALTEATDKAIEYLERAGDRAEMVFAHPDAERDYRQVVELARKIGDTQRESSVLEKLGTTLTVASRYDEALEALEQSAQLRRAAGELEAEARVTARIGEVHRHRGSLEEGIARVQSILPALASLPPSSGLASLYLALHHLQFAAGQDESSLTAAGQAAALGQALGDRQIEAEAEVARGSALAKLGHQHQAEGVLENAVTLAETVNDLPQLHRAHNNLGFIRASYGAFGPALRSLECAREIVERTADPAHLSFQLAQEGLVLVFLGDWEEAQMRLERALQLLPEGELSWYHTYPALCLGQLLLRQGQSERAGQEFQRALDIACGSGDIQGQLCAHGGLAERDLADGRPEAAITRLAPLLAEHTGDLIYLLSPLAEAYLLVGEEVRSESLLVQAEALARGYWWRYLPIVLRVRGMLLRRRRQWNEAEAILDEAATLARSMPFPYAEARALYERGVVSLDRGCIAGAQKQLRDALAIFRTLGASANIERTRQALIRTKPSISIDAAPPTPPVSAAGIPPEHGC